MTRTDVDSRAAWVLAATTSLLTVFLPPLLIDGTLFTRLVAAVLAMIGNYSLYSVAHNWLNHRRIGSLLGKWLYIAYPHRSASGQIYAPPNICPPLDELSFGLMEFHINREGEIGYKVSLFKRPEDLLCTTDGATKDHGAVVARIGLATSEAIEYNPTSQTVILLYHVRYFLSHQNDRYGRLFLDISPFDEQIDKCETHKQQYHGWYPVRELSI